MPEPPQVKVELLEQAIGQARCQTNNEWADYLDIDKPPKRDDGSCPNIETLSDVSIEMPRVGDRTERPLMAVIAPV